ncbi:MAG: hypothetical protein JWQ57_2212, partial [Mucilaginibacter sp.]|nr:hypothetical protein [Mucilaginibacter sp.]
SLDEWCAEIGNEFLLTTNQIDPPYSFLKLLPFRKIKFNQDTNLFVSGKIELEETGFVLKINPLRLSNKQQYNLTFAHEIAHTYLYNFQNGYPIESSGFLPTSTHIEYLCNKIARYLIIPSTSLKRELMTLPKMGSPEFDFKCINRLCEIYETTPYVILKRCIHDELYWNVLSLKFKYFSEDKSWKLFSFHFPQYLNSNKNKSKFFIPPGVLKSKRPSAKKELAFFLNNIYLELKYNPIINKLVLLKDFVGEPLHSVFNNVISDNPILIYLSLDNDSNSINLIIPLNESVYGFKNIPE